MSLEVAYSQGWNWWGGPPLLKRSRMLCVWMWELDHKESSALKNSCLQTVVLEKTLESPLDSKEIKPVNPKGNQHWVFIERTDADTEASILWPPDAKGRLIGKALDAGKDWGQEEKGVTENEMIGWHHWLNGLESEKTSEDSEGQGSLASCNLWVHKESDMTEWLDNNKTNNENRGPSVVKHWRCSFSSHLGLTTYVGNWEWNVSTSWGRSINPMGPVFP